MQASGTSEGLRGPIDGPLPKSVKKIIQPPGCARCRKCSTTRPNEANHTPDTEPRDNEPHKTAGQTAEAIVGRGMDDVEMEEASAAPDDEAPDNVSRPPRSL